MRLQLPQRRQHLPYPRSHHGLGQHDRPRWLDERIDKALVIGHFGPRGRVWEEPAYRNVFGLLNDYGDAELARLVAPRSLMIDPALVPDIVAKGGDSPWGGVLKLTPAARSFS